MAAGATPCVSIGVSGVVANAVAKRSTWVGPTFCVSTSADIGDAVDVNGDAS